MPFSRPSSMHFSSHTMLWPILHMVRIPSSSSAASPGTRPARRSDGFDQRRHLGAPAAARERPDGPRRRLGYRPRAADGGHELEGRRVREVGARLEFRARFEQYAAEPVLAARVLAGQEVPLRDERPGGLYLRCFRYAKSERIAE